VLLGIDIGTSSVKALLLSEDLRTLGSGRAATPWAERDGHVEMDPGALLRSVLAAAEACLGEGEARVCAIGVTGIAESGVLVDTDGRPCAPILAWYDERGEREEAELKATFGRAAFAELTGQMVRRRLSAIKYRWLRRAIGRPAAEATWLPLPEWIVGELGGEPRPELSQWSRTGLLSIQRAGACEPLAVWAGYPLSRLGEPVAAGTAMGRASRSGIDERCAGAILTSAGHDHLCAALGAGATGPHVAFDSWGNGEALMRSVPFVADRAEVIEDGVTVSWHVVPGSHLVMAGLGTGLTLRDCLARLGVDPERREELDRAAADLDPAAGDGPAAAWRGALEGAAETLREAIGRIEARWGPIQDIVGCGGWLLSEPIRRLRVAQIPGYRVAPAAQPGAVGAAVLGAVAAEVLTLDGVATQLGAGVR
jgi:sugar (pentulose or hexulose) kinase